MRTASRAIVGTMLVVLVVGCGTSSPPQDTGANDGGAATDAPAAPDTRDPGDAMPMVDVAPDVDAGPLPEFDDSTEAHVRELIVRGQARGNRADVFSKIGDSISESRAFMYECGDGAFLPGPHTDLEPTVQYFTMRMLDADGFNSFTRGGLSAVGGWTVADALEGGKSPPVAQELDAIQPQWAIIMFGTNDLERIDVATYTVQLGRLLDIVEARGVVPVLSTIPPRDDSAMLGARVQPFNDAVRTLARTRHVPWMDYWAVLAPLPGHGLGPDGIHPDVFQKGGMRTCDVSDEAVRHGYNARNLLAIQMLARLRAF